MPPHLTRPFPHSASPYLSEVAEGTFAYVQPDGGWCLNNAGCLVSDGQSLLVDTAATQKRALALKEAITTVCASPPRFVVNTHSHGDHTFGNSVFAEHAAIVAHDATRAEMDALGLHLTTLWPDVGWGELSVTLPTVTYHDRLTLRVGQEQADLIALGPAHTAVDTVVWLPRQRVLFAGDLLMSGATPFCLMGSVSGSLEAVAQLRALDPEVVVAGHGPVTGPSVLDTVDRYLRWLQHVAADGLAAGLTPLEVAHETTLGEWAELLDSERLVPNLHRAYAEAQGAVPGQQLDVSGMFSDMVTYHGELPTCHA